VGKAWSVFFGVIILACFASLAISPFVGWWLPKNVASFGGDVDFLFYIILWFTGFFFVLTEAVLVVAMWRFGHDPNRKSTYVHGNHRLEVFWTVVPAGILLYIAFAQVPAWARMKSAEPTSWFVYGKFKVKNEDPDMVVQVTARQWEWRMRYSAEYSSGRNQPTKEYRLVPTSPRAWADHPQIDDLHGTNELHTWKDANVRVYLKTLDVIHSFFMPNLRLKQDALPGRTIVIWFRPVEANCKFDAATHRTVPLDRPTWAESQNEWEIACAELCGSRHYAMRGRLYVHESKDDFLEWLKDTHMHESATKPDEKRTAEKKDK
jgi:cytochrome c oxidase subunit 2